MLNGLPILNPFPDLLVLEHLAPLILRVVLGFIILNVGYLKFKSELPRWRIFMEAFGFKHRGELVKALGVVEIVSGVMLIVGFYTQIAALVLAILAFIELFAEQKESVLVKRDMVFYILVFAIALSLLFTGAGAFSLDLPL